MDTALIECKAKKRDDGLVEFVASTDRVDRAGDVIEQNWDLKQFRKNPVFLWGHRYGDLPIGRIVKVWTEPVAKAGAKPGHATKATRILVKFVDAEIYPFAGIVKTLYETGVLSSVSVGFRPLKRKALTDEERSDAGMGTWGAWFEKSELLEVSGVTVPMNPDALAAGITAGAFPDERAARAFSTRSPLEGADISAVQDALKAAETGEWADEGDGSGESGSPGQGADEARSSANPPESAPANDLGIKMDALRGTIEELISCLRAGLEPADIGGRSDDGDPDSAADDGDGLDGIPEDELSSFLAECEGFVAQEDPTR